MRVALAIALAALAVGAPAVGAAQRSLGVSLREFRVGPYRENVRVGTLRIHAYNYGEDPHDLVLRTRTGRVVARTPEIRAGERFTVSVRLRRAGTYYLVCSLPGHEEAGMRARLRVRSG